MTDLFSRLARRALLDQHAANDVSLDLRLEREVPGERDESTAAVPVGDAQQPAGPDADPDQHSDSGSVTRTPAARAEREVAEMQPSNGRAHADQDPSGQSAPSTTTAVSLPSGPAPTAGQLEPDLGVARTNETPGPQVVPAPASAETATTVQRTEFTTPVVASVGAAQDALVTARPIPPQPSLRHIERVVATPPSDTTVHIHIGRLDVRAPKESKSAAATNRSKRSRTGAPVKPLDLGDYLKGSR